jgi:hypothetical protein
MTDVANSETERPATLKLRAAWDKQVVLFELWDGALTIRGGKNFQDCYEIERSDLPQLIAFLSATEPTK